MADDTQPTPNPDAESGAERNPSVYDPSEVEATRARQQGLGVGAKDLARQRDPTGGVETEQQE